MLRKISFIIQTSYQWNHLTCNFKRSFEKFVSDEVSNIVINSTVFVSTIYYTMLTHFTLFTILLAHCFFKTRLLVSFQMVCDTNFYRFKTMQLVWILQQHLNLFSFINWTLNKFNIYISVWRYIYTLIFR